MAEQIASETRTRAQRSGGTSDAAVYEMVKRTLEQRGVTGDVAFDLGCGNGAFFRTLEKRFTRYVGVDAVRYDGFPANSKFVEADLNVGCLPLESRAADAVFALETIEHLENPRAFMREMLRIAKPNAWIVVTTPNQLSGLSLGTLVFKKRFSAFQDVHYPAHITALLESDLLRMAKELRLIDPQIEYSRSGRIVLTSARFPKFFANLFPRFCSDNILLIARAP